MKVVTSVTIHHREKPEAKEEVLAPGEHDLSESVAKSLIRRGHAKPLERAKADAVAEESAKVGTVQVKAGGKGAQAK